MPAQSQSVPPKISTAPSLKIFFATVLGFVILGMLAVIFFFDPAKNNFYPTCTFHELTGLNCPGCGATRALYALLHGNFRVALKDNALFIFSLAAVLVWSTSFTLQKLRNRQAALHSPSKMLWAFLAVAVVFTVLRNLPAFSFLSP